MSFTEKHRVGHHEAPARLRAETPQPAMHQQQFALCVQ